MSGETAKIDDTELVQRLQKTSMRIYWWSLGIACAVTAGVALVT